VALVDTFQELAYALAYEQEFRDVEIVAHRARRAGRNVELSLTVDRPGGVDLQLCERIAARINAALEAEPEPYTLEVGSAGLDRPLSTPADYERFRDKAVVVTTTLPISSEYTHRGTLLGLRGNLIVLATKSGELPIPIELVKASNIEYDYRADLRRDKKERREKR
jgi:ribosome maturation factor RimP